MRAPLLLQLFSSLALIAGAAPTCVHASTQSTTDRCWADWSTAAPVVHRESLRPAKDVRALTAQAQGQLLNITLCEEHGRFVYRLLILRAGGTVEALTVDARSPFGK